MEGSHKTKRATARLWPSESCVASRGGSRRPSSDAAEPVDGVDVLGPHLLVEDAEALLGGEGEDPDLALVLVVVHVEGGLTDLVEGVGPREGGVDLALGDEPVGLPRLAVVGEVAGDD